MALIGQIRKRGSWILIVLIGLGLGGFIVQDMLVSGPAQGMGSQSSDLGKVNGEEISLQEFNKVEQFCVSTVEDSYKILDEMQRITEKFFESLKIPYRVIEICSGDLGNKMARQYDIEAWFPRQKAYKEVTSAGNATDYQARRINVKYYEGKEKKIPHMINNTMVATSRTIVAILENYQQKDGSIKIPEVLQKYTGFKKIN